jgi:hypothetical protein
VQLVLRSKVVLNDNWRAGQDSYWPGNAALVDGTDLVNVGGDARREVLGMPKPANAFSPLLLLRRSAYPVGAGPSMGVNDPKALVFLSHVPQQLDQNEVFENIGVVAGMEGVTVGEHVVGTLPGGKRASRCGRQQLQRSGAWRG